MTTSKFDQQVLIEQLRYIEAQDTLACDMDDLTAELPPNHDFSARLWLRATRLVNCNELKPGLHRAANLTRMANGAGLLVAAMLGALATNLALSGSSTINIYWLLLVLLGFNFLSMLLWLVGISFKLDGLMAGGLAKITCWLPLHFKEKSQTSSAADRAWLACHFGARVGKWQLSAITHQLWLVYLLAGLAVLVLVLMARQYDFVWGTTLLSDDAFVSLTELLGKPLQMLGLTTPASEQVQQTRIGIDYSLTAAHRNSWAQFLLGAILVYGILPRLLLWFWAMLMRAAAKRSFTLDYYLPYYIGLRQQLVPQAAQGQIDDADQFPLESSSALSINDSGLSVPTEARWVGVELGEDIHWPPASINVKRNYGYVSDRQSLDSILQRLGNDVTGHTGGVIAVAVAAARAPDRGVQRTIAMLFATGTQPWLVLMHEPKHASVTETRLAAWYRLAEACGVPADQVVSIGAV